MLRWVYYIQCITLANLPFVINDWGKSSVCKRTLGTHVRSVVARPTTRSSQQRMVLRKIYAKTGRKNMTNNWLKWANVWWQYINYDRHKLNSRRRFLGYKCKLCSDSAADSHTTEQKLSFVDFKSLFWEICNLNFHGNKPKWLYFASKFVGSFDVVLNCGKGS